MNEEEQSNEIMVLESIYDSKISTCQKEGRYHGTMKIDLEIPNNYLVTYKLKEETNLQTFEVDFLPPIELNFEFYPKYPSEEPPGYTLNCSWLTTQQLMKMCLQLDEIWNNNKNEVVIYEWISFLSNNTLEELGLTKSLDLTDLMEVKASLGAQASISQSSNNLSLCSQNKENNKGVLHLPQKRKSGDFDERVLVEYSYEMEMPSYIQSYNVDKKQDKFNKSLFTCEVCMADKKGLSFFKFPGCEHIFCRECVKEYFEVQIKEGNVQMLSCMFDKCPSTAIPDQVANLVSPELFKRYDELLLSSALKTMDDIYYCPRRHCQAAVLVEPKGFLAICPNCKYSFCTLCKATTHGINPCKIGNNELEKIIETYRLARDNNDETAKRLEKRYGKRQLERYLEETLTSSWLSNNSKLCPKCKTNIEKIDGCHKMTCKSCTSYFCWLCMEILDPAKPYAHFSNRASECYNKLFLNVEGAEYEEQQFQEVFELGYFAVQ